MVRSWISGKGEVWMNTDVRELSFDETENEACSPFDGPVVDVQLENNEKILDDDEFDHKDPEELEDDNIEDDDFEDDLDMEDIDDFENDEVLDDDDDGDDPDDMEEDEF